MCICPCNIGRISLDKREEPPEVGWTNRCCFFLFRCPDFVFIAPRGAEDATKANKEGEPSVEDWKISRGRCRRSGIHFWMAGDPNNPFPYHFPPFPSQARRNEWWVPSRVFFHHIAHLATKIRFQSSTRSTRNRSPSSWHLFFHFFTRWKN